MCLISAKCNVTEDTYDQNSKRLIYYIMVGFTWAQGIRVSQSWLCETTFGLNSVKPEDKLQGDDFFFLLSESQVTGKNKEVNKNHTHYNSVL